VMSVMAYLKAGIDLEQIKDEDLLIEGKKIVVKLPRAKLISLNLPPEEIKEEDQKTGFFRDGFNNAEKIELLSQAENSIRNSVDSLGILKKAEENAVFFIGKFIKRLGYEDVTITFDPLPRSNKNNGKKL
jgi:hypothetical protein